MPRKSVPRITAIQVSVVAALRGPGFLKAGTPLEMASTPVIAVQPAANALRIRKSESGSVAATNCKWAVIGWDAREKDLMTPTTIRNRELEMKILVWIAKH